MRWSDVIWRHYHNTPPCWRYN